jgi:hypothetical protein
VGRPGLVVLFSLGAGVLALACGLSINGTGTLADGVVALDGAAPDATSSIEGGSTVEGGGIEGADAGGDAPNDAASSGCDADFTNDSKNCGACAHDCMGGSCEAGACTVVDVGATVEGLAQGLFVDDKNVYFTDTGSGGSVKECSIAGCGGAPTVLANGLNSPNAVIAAGGNVYWTNFGAYTLDECAVAGCNMMPTPFTSVTVSTNGFGRLATDGTSLFFSDGGNGIVRSCPLAGCGAGPTVLATLQANPWGIAVDAANVYWVNDVTTGTVVTCPKSGCGLDNTLLVTLATNQDTPRTMAIDATDTFWVTQGGGTVMKCAKAGCGQKPTTLASGIMTPQGVAVDDVWVYFTERTTNMVKKVPKAGGGVVVVAAGQTGAFNVAVDATSVYWTNDDTNGSVRRVAK